MGKLVKKAVVKWVKVLDNMRFPASFGLIESRRL